MGLLTALGFGMGFLEYDRSNWDTYACCKNCNGLIRAPFGSLHHVHESVCPRCGEPKSQFHIVTARVVNGKVEIKRERHDQD